MARARGNKRLVKQPSAFYPVPSPNYWSPLLQHKDDPPPFREDRRHGGDSGKSVSSPLPSILKGPATTALPTTGILPLAPFRRVKWRDVRDGRRMERRAENKQRRREIRKAALEEERWIANYSLINAKEELKEADRKRMMGERTASGKHGGKGREELVRSLGEALKIKVLSRKRMKPLLER